MSKHKAQMKAIVDWFTGNGANTMSEAWDQIQTATVYSMCQDMAEAGYEVPGVSVGDIANGEWSIALGIAFEAAHDGLRAEAQPFEAGTEIWA